VHVGLNKGQAKNALAKAVFFNRLDEMRDRSFENQRYRASGLNLVVAAIIPWNTVYLERAIRCLKEHGLTSDENLLKHVSPLGWEHIKLTGDYVWRQNKRVEHGKFRPLPLPELAQESFLLLCACVKGAPHSHQDTSGLPEELEPTKDR
jgi:Tn3 transposase DDE domain